MTNKLVQGVGVNDVRCRTKFVVDGVIVRCKIYEAWRSMLTRCYSAKWVNKYPTYSGCSVSDDWLIFSNFKRWMESQDWKGKQLDKDILSRGNKLYSPDYCCFVSSITNTFMTDSGAVRGEWPIGVSYNRARNKFISECSNPFTKKKEYLGGFENEISAHEAWRNRKHQLALQLADTQSDARVADALRVRYLNTTIGAI